MSRTLYSIVIALAVLQGLYGLFWPGLAILEFQSIIHISLPTYFASAIRAAPAIMVINAFVYGALYVLAAIAIVRNEPKALWVFGAGLALHLANWFASIGLGEYNGEIGAAFVLNGLILLLALLYRRQGLERG